VAHYGRPQWKQQPAPRYLSLVDHLFLISHDEQSGKRLMAPDVLGVGLVAAALTELVATKSIDVITETGIVTRIATEFPADPACGHVLEQIYAQEPSEHTATDWILALRDDLYTGVATRLEQDRLVRHNRVGLTRTLGYTPTQPMLVAEPMSWVFGVLRARNAGEDFEPIQRALACLCAAMGVATAVTAIANSDVTHTYPKLLQLCDEPTITIAKSTQRAMAKLATKLRR
jgi:hypothetical protein